MITIAMRHLNSAAYVCYGSLRAVRLNLIR